MSRNAEAWFFDECQIRGNEGWVLITLCSYTDDDGYAALSKKSLTAKTLMSEATVYRALQSLAEGGILEFVRGPSGPSWWKDIPANRRPRLVRMTAFLGSRFATPTGPGVSQGCQTGAPGVSQGCQGTGSDQDFSDAMVDGVTDTRLRRRPDGKCAEWVEVAQRHGDIGPSVAPCSLAADHSGSCEAVSETTARGELVSAWTHQKGEAVTRHLTDEDREAIDRMFRDIGPDGPHADHKWREVPPCVYCVTCDKRLYQGSIPEWKDPDLAAKRATCAHVNHEGYDDGDGWREMGEGFYWVCADCGFKGWYE